MLTARQSKFVDEYHLSGNGARAAVVAGYSAPSARITASKLLTNPNIQAALAELRTETQAAFQISRQTVVNGLLDAIGHARVADQPAAEIRGWSELAKICGHYAPETRRVELSAESMARRAEYEAMSDEELLAVASSIS